MNIAVISSALTRIASRVLYEGDDYIDIYLDYFKYFKLGNIFSEILRNLGAFIINFLRLIYGLLRQGLEYAYKFISFDSWLMNPNPNYGGGAFFEKYMPIVYAVLGVAIIAVGLLFIIGSDQIKGKKVIQNIALAIAIFGLMPAFINELTSLTNIWFDAHTAEFSSDSIIPDGSVVDLVYVFGNGASKSEIDSKMKNQDTMQGFTDNDFGYIDFTERIKPDGSTGEIFKYHIVRDMNSDSRGQYTVREIKVLEVLGADFYDMGLTVLCPYYYRYQVEWLTVILVYCAYILVVLFTIIRCFRLAYEIVTSHFIALFVAAGDIASGRKIKQILEYLFYTFLTLMYAIIALVLFTKFIEYLNHNDTGYPPLIRGFFTFLGTYIVIDGPAIMQRIFGIDAGLQDGFTAMDRLMHAGRMGRMVGGLLSSPAKAAKAAGNAVDSLGNAAEKIGGAITGTGTGKGGALSSGKPSAELVAKAGKQADTNYKNRDQTGEQNIPIDKSLERNGERQSSEADMIRAANQANGHVTHMAGTLVPNSNIAGSKKDRGSVPVDANYSPNDMGVDAGSAWDAAKSQAAKDSGINLKDYHLDPNSMKVTTAPVKGGTTDDQQADIIPQDQKSAMPSTRAGIGSSQTASVSSTTATGSASSESASAEQALADSGNISSTQKSGSAEVGVQGVQTGTVGRTGASSTGVSSSSIPGQTAGGAASVGAGAATATLAEAGRTTADVEGVGSDFSIPSENLSGSAQPSVMEGEASVNSASTITQGTIADVSASAGSASRSVQTLSPSDHSVSAQTSSNSAASVSEIEIAGSSSGISSVAPADKTDVSFSPSIDSALKARNEAYAANEQEYYSGHGDFSVVTIPAPKSTTNEGLASAAFEGVSKQEPGSMVYTEIEMGPKVGLGETNTVGFTFETTGDNRADARKYMISFKKAVQGWYNDNPSKSNTYSASVKRVMKNNRRKK